jgi:hypothetical protein
MRLFGKGLLLSSLLAFTCAASVAGNIDEKILGTDELATLQARADASPKEQCYIYALMAHQMVELAGRQMAAGETEKIAQTLAKLENYTDRIHGGLGADTKKLKDTEILMRHSALRLTELLHNTSTDDQPEVASKLKHFEQVRGELMFAIFAH